MAHHYAKKEPDIQTKVDSIVAKAQPRNKRMMIFSSQHCTFDLQHSTKRGTIVTIDDSHVEDQKPIAMATHQIRFDDGIFFCLSLMVTLFNHGSQFDAHHLLNMLFPLVKTPTQMVEYVPFNQGTNIHL